MVEIVVESTFGLNAGKVWDVLDRNGPSTITDIRKATDLTREQIYGALGWLGRENKITMEKRGNITLISLRP